MLAAAVEFAEEPEVEFPVAELFDEAGVESVDEAPVLLDEVPADSAVSPVAASEVVLSS